MALPNAHEHDRHSVSEERPASIRPDMVGALRPQTEARAVVEPEAPAFRLLGGHFQPLTSPDPLDTLLVHQPALRSSAVIRRYP
jgi:hypothetical protein